MSEIKGRLHLGNRRCPGYMNKRGQFYIIAAVLITMVLFGMAGVATYTVIKPEPRTIKDLSSDLNRESYKIIEYGIHEERDLVELSESFAGDDVAEYFLKKTDNANIAFVYGGDRNNLYTLSYKDKHTGSVKIGGGEWETSQGYYKTKKLKAKDFEDDFIKVKILDTTYFFDLKDNEMFYFVIVKERGKEKFIERNEKPSKKDRPGGKDRKSKKDRKGGGKKGGGGGDDNDDDDDSGSGGTSGDSEG